MSKLWYAYYKYWQLGTNKDGSINDDYCKYCYKKGEFIDKVTLEEYIDMCSQYGEQAGMTNEEMKNIVVNYSQL